MTTDLLSCGEYFVENEPYYESTGDEIAIFEAAYQNKLPVLLKGPTGCGKTRFMEYMAWRLKRPLITVSCHDDLTASVCHAGHPDGHHPGHLAGDRRDRSR